MLSSSLCFLNLIGQWGMCSRKRQSLFNFQFCLPALSSSDLRHGLLGLQIVCLEQNQRRVARLVQSLVQEEEEDSFSFFVFVCFSCETHTVRQRRRQLLPARTQTHAAPGGRTCQYSQKYKWEGVVLFLSFLRLCDGEENLTRWKLIVNLCQDELCFIHHCSTYSIYATCYCMYNIVTAHEMRDDGRLHDKNRIRFKTLWLDSGDIMISRGGIPAM